MTTGAKLWSTGGFYCSSPAVANGMVYVGGGDSNVYAPDATTGARLWYYTTGGPRVDSSPAVANGVVYVGSMFDYKVYALNATTGAELWDYTTGYWVVSSPAVVNGVVYVGSGDGNFYAIGTQTEPSQPTHLTLTTSNPTPQAGQQFTLSGALTTDSGTVTHSYPPKAAAGTGVAGQPIYIQELQGGTWVNIQGPITTDQNGAFSFAMTLTAPGQHSLRAHYSGTAQYAACDSLGTLTITVKGNVSPSPSISPSPSPSVSPTTSPTVTPSIKPSPEFPLAGFGAGAVMCALVAAYLMLRRY